jgi:hypothetical protein
MRRFCSASYAGGCHGVPAPRDASSSPGHVLNPNSPSFGMVYQIHSRSPVRALRDSIHDRAVPLSLPDTTYTCSRTTNGAFAETAPPMSFTQRSSPVAASRAVSPPLAIMNSVSPAIARPRCRSPPLRAIAPDLTVRLAVDRVCVRPDRVEDRPVAQ